MMEPIARFAASSSSARIAIGQRSALTRPRSRSHQPKRKNSTTPASSKISWNVSSPGVAVAQIASPSVHRKKAIVSGSKPERSIERISR